MDFDTLKYNAKQMGFVIALTASAVTTFWKNDFRLLTIERDREEEAKEINIYREHQEEIFRINKENLEAQILYNDDKMKRNVKDNTDFFNKMLNEMKADQLEQWKQINVNKEE